MDTIGRISVPDITSSGLTFPLVSDFGYGFTQQRPIITHEFGTLDAKVSQRFKVGMGPKKHAFRRQRLSFFDRDRLSQFWEGIQGAWASFLYNVPNADQSTTSTTVVWEYAPLSFQYFVNACSVGLNFIEVPTATPTYTVAQTQIRFPEGSFQTALLGQVQEFIPLVHIRVRESAVPDMYFSDRRCIIGSQLYVPRLINIGEPGSDVLLTQDINGTADNVTFTFGNADRVMGLLSNDTDLKFAQIDLSLYDTTSQTLLQLWMGNIVNFKSDGTANFSVQASDGLWQVNLLYPTRLISRTCWKTFNDGVNCPYSSAGSGGDPTSCDYYFNSTNGCLSHGMAPYFGGQPAQSQGVNIKDNSTGVMGFGRNIVTATSIISDSAWGQALPEIWCNGNYDPNMAFWTNAIIVSGRDESDFYDALGIIGLGPIGGFSGMTVAQNSDGFRYIVAPLLDGFTPHGFRVDSNLNIQSNSTTLGLREVEGDDPNFQQFALSQTGGIPGGFSAGTAAGTSFVEVRRTDQPGIQPTPADSHQLQVPLNMGLSGWTWDHTGTRTLTAGLTNPFWIAVNSYLRAVGMWTASSAAQLALFDLGSLDAGDGSGSAEIANDRVPLIIGPTGYELQFQFQGIIGARKAFRDWLMEIISCGLGYYTWSFGKLRLGTRINASAVDAYTTGNIILNSLSATPIEAAFEHLTIEFADQAYQYQANTGDYQDKDHAAYYGRAGAPLSSTMHSVGTPTLTQALRLAVTRTREEVGGINATEWRNARMYNWQTTLLGLNNHIGQVISITEPYLVPGRRGICNVAGAQITWVSGDAFDPDMVDKEIVIQGVPAIVYSVSGTVANLNQLYVTATGQIFRIITADVRVQGWKLKRDYSIEITAKTVTQSMYDLTVGPKPADVIPGSLPRARYPVPMDMVWSPYLIQGPSWDALFAGEWTFDIDQDYIALADGSAYARLLVTGRIPINATSPVTGSTSPVLGQVAVYPTGGSLQGGQTLRVALCVSDSAGRLSAPSQLGLVKIPKTTWNDFDPDITYGGTEWTYSTDRPGWGGTATYSKIAGNTITFSFIGTSITIQYIAQLNCGVVSIAIDGVVVSATLDTYNGPGATEQVTFGGLIPGATHALVITVLGTFNSPSVDAFFILDAIMVEATIPSEDNTYQLVLSNIIWPGVAGLVSYVLFAHYQDDLICAQQNDYVVPDVGSAWLPTTITFLGPITRGGWSLPSAYVDKLRIKAKKGIAVGVAYGQVTAVPNSVQVIVAGLAGATANYNGRVLSVIGRADSSTPVLNVIIQTFDPSLGMFSVLPQAVVVGDLFESIRTGDIVAVRFACDDQNHANPTQITDSTAYFLSGAMVGNLIRVLSGTGRGTPPRKIVGNTNNTLFWDQNLEIDATSIFIIEEPTWSWSADGTSLDNSNPASTTEFAVPVTNYNNQFMIVSGFTVDIYGNESADQDQPVREQWIYGNDPSRVVNVFTSIYYQQQNDVTLYVYTAAGPVTIYLLPDKEWFSDLFITKVTADGNAVTVIPAAGESINGQAALVITDAGVPYVLSPTDGTAVAFHSGQTTGQVGTGPAAGSIPVGASPGMIPVGQPIGSVGGGAIPPPAPPSSGNDTSGTITWTGGGAPWTPSITTWHDTSGVYNAVMGSNGSETYSYVVVAHTPGGLFESAVGTTTTGGTILSRTSFNSINWNALVNASSYDVYRVLGWLVGKIASGVTKVFFNDTGYVGDGNYPPTILPETGVILVTIQNSDAVTTTLLMVTRVDNAVSNAAIVLTQDGVTVASGLSATFTYSYINNKTSVSVFKLIDLNNGGVASPLFTVTV